MTDLELILRQTGAALEWPATPDLAAAVSARVRVDGVPRSRAPRFRLRRPLAIALAALLVVAGGAAAVPAIRDPVLDFLGLRSVKIERVPRLPNVRPQERSELGVRTTFARARAQVPFAPVSAPGLGKSRAYVDFTPPGGRITLAYRGGRIVLTEFEGNLHTPFLEKMLGPGTTAERVSVKGQRGLWLAGSPHVVVFLDSQGEVRDDTLHRAGPTLVWRRGGLLLRLEGVRSKRAALRIASAVR